MNGIQLAQRATIGLVAGVAGLGIGVAAFGAAEAAEKDDANAIVKLGTNLGLPIVAVGSIISPPRRADRWPPPCSARSALVPPVA